MNDPRLVVTIPLYIVYHDLMIYSRFPFEGPAVHRFARAQGYDLNRARDIEAGKLNIAGKEAFDVRIVASSALPGPATPWKVKNWVYKLESRMSIILEGW